MKQRISNSTILICILSTIILILSVCLVKEIKTDHAAGCYLEAAIDLRLDYTVFVSKYGSIVTEEEYSEIQSIRSIETTKVSHCYLRQLDDGTMVVFVLTNTLNNDGSYKLIDIEVIRK